MRGWLLLAAFSILTGCAAEISSRSVVTSCILPDDQTGTFDGRWKVAPIPIAVQSGQFSADEKATIVQAIQRWNSFTRLSLKQDIFIVAEDSSLPRPSSVCAGSTPVLLGSQFVNPIVVRKHGSWIYPSATSAIAITSTCPLADTPVNKFYAGALDLNYQHFFVSGKPQPDLQSIMVHELGHLIGLRHSCENSPTRPNTPNCNDSGIDSNYKTAVMFPVFGFTGGYGEKRSTLNVNDQGRANCLYLTP